MINFFLSLTQFKQQHILANSNIKSNSSFNIQSI
jgi:hypothetical protein